MSHSVTLVLLSKLNGDVEEQVQNALNPFDENKEVPEHETDCHCIDDVARREAAKAAEEKTGTNIRKLRDSFWEDRPKGETPEQRGIVWKAFVKDYVEAEKTAFESHPMKNKPDPECGFYCDGDNAGERYEDGSGCGGTGKYLTTYNPKSKWDWFAIGGRWQGCLGPDNVKKVSEIGDFCPFSILTPDGQWHEKGEMGWWGVVSDEKDNWTDQAKEILSKHQDCYAVVVDVHI